MGVMVLGRLRRSTAITALCVVCLAGVLTAESPAAPVIPTPRGLPSCFGAAPTKVGTAGNDVIVGTGAADVIVGLGGNDRIYGLGGNDKLCGGTGYDRLYGGTGSDRLEGDGGIDFCSGDVVVGCEQPLALTSFDPRVSGFHFVNFFHQPINVHLPLGIGSVNLANFVIGLCGGMSYAAADSYFFGAPTPSGDQEPPLHSNLRNYLVDRQLFSLLYHAAGNLRQFAEWMAYPLKTQPGGPTGLNVRSNREFHRYIQKALDLGRPIPIDIVKATVSIQNPNPLNILKNHQVLAIGYFVRAGEIIIEVYDPNFPADPRYGDTDGDGITYLNSAQHRQTSDEAGTHRIGSFRGFFHSAGYSAKRPPWAPPAGAASQR